MSTKIDELYEEANSLAEEAAGIEARYGTRQDNWPTGQRTRFANLVAGANARYDEIKTLEARQSQREELRSAALNPSNLEAGAPTSPSGFRERSNPWRNLDGDLISRADTADGLRERALDALELVPDVPTSRRQMVAEMLGTRSENDPVALMQHRATAEYVLAAANPAYRSAFLKVLRNPTHGFLNWTEHERQAYSQTEAVRAAMSLTDGNGGYLVPFTLDPTIVLTNTGALNPWRELSTIKTTATNTWNGVSSAGVNAEWLGEGVEAADASPTVGNIEIPTFKGSAWVYGSYEVLADSDFATQLPTLLADAKDRLEEAAFATGNGTTAPQGVLTGATAVDTGAVATFVAADVYRPFDALPSRWYNNASVVMNKGIGLKVRQFDTAGGSSFWANLGDKQPERLLGRPYRESSTMVSTLTTGSDIMAVGDFSQYFIVDRLGTTMVYEPLVKGSNQRPTGQAGWFAFWRTGGKKAVGDAFRVLNVA